jgi:hypothetical protein
MVQKRQQIVKNVSGFQDQCLKGIYKVPFILRKWNYAPRYSDLTLRVARFFLVQNTKTEKIYQIATKCTKCP